MNLLKLPSKPRRMPRQKPGKSKQDYRTPTELISAVLRLLEIKKFDIDLAADEDNAVAKKFYGIVQNALAQPWRVGDGWNWLNPPFGRLAPWVKRAWEQSQLEDAPAQTAMLVPASVGSNYWKKYVHRKARVLMLNGRIKFVGAPQGYPKDCCVLLFGPGVHAGYEVWTWNKELNVKLTNKLLRRVA
jgi:phage N-6-adenine-methyltransferase